MLKSASKNRKKKYVSSRPIFSFQFILLCMIISLIYHVDITYCKRNDIKGCIEKTVYLKIKNKLQNLD